MATRAYLSFKGDLAQPLGPGAGKAEVEKVLLSLFAHYKMATPDLAFADKHASTFWKGLALMLAYDLVPALRRFRKPRRSGRPPKVGGLLGMMPNMALIEAVMREQIKAPSDGPKVTVESALKRLKRANALPEAYLNLKVSTLRREYYSELRKAKAMARWRASVPPPAETSAPAKPGDSANRLFRLAYGGVTET